MAVTAASHFVAKSTFRAAAPAAVMADAAATLS